MKQIEIEKLLVEAGFLNRKALERAHLIQNERGGDLIQILVKDGSLKEIDFVAFMASHLRVPFLSILSIHLSQEWIRLIPRNLAYRYDSIVVSKIADILTVALADPMDITAIDDLRQATGMQIAPVFAPRTEIRNALDEFYEGSENLSTVIESVAEDELKILKEKIESEELNVKETDVPLIQMVNLILQDAIRQRASDIHFERFEDRFLVRYRVDGVLKEAVRPPLNVHPAVTARLKILASMDITEKRLPQDGRFKIRFGEKEINFRVSVLPTYFGEKIVLRILDTSSLHFGLDRLGFGESDLKKLKIALEKPYGMVLVTGPTGSGKSTTLYSILNQLNTPERNIMTVEDPVEYHLEGITQTQANPEIGLTFASGLRSLLRQNPDIILVGEIRDGETADISVKAALTGHMVFSTLHTNSAAGSITRLVDMKVEPFLIGASLNISIAQRLCRKICDRCKESVEIPKETLTRLHIKAGDAWQGKGCSHCHGTGYLGRMALCEVLEVDDEIRQMIIDGCSSYEIHDRAVKKGMRTLFDDAIDKFTRGLTTLEEILRVTAEENF